MVHSTIGLASFAFTACLTAIAGPQAADFDPVAVAGFAMADGTQARDMWMAVALEEVLCGRLRRVPRLTVIPTARVNQALRDAESSGVAGPSIDRLVPMLGARYVLSGTCSAGVRTITLELRVSEIGGTALATTRLSADTIFELIDQATRWALAAPGIAGPVTVEGSPAPRALDEARAKLVFARPAASPSALEYYAKAVSAARRSDLRDASAYLTESLGYDRFYRDAILLHARLVMQGGVDSRGEAIARFRLLGDIARDQGDALDRANAELGLGSLALMGRQFEVALGRFEHALALAAELDEPYTQIAAMGHICDLYIAASTAPEVPSAARKLVHRQDLERVAEWQTEVLNLVERLGDVLAEGPAASKLALVLEQIDRANEAGVLLERCLEAARRSELASAQATAWLVHAQFLARQERWPEALESAERCLKHVAPTGEPAVRITLAEIQRGLKRPKDALAQFEGVHALMRKKNDLDGELVCLQHIADLRMELGQRAAALRALQDAIDVAHAVKSPLEAALSEKLKTWKRGN